MRSVAQPTRIMKATHRRHAERVGPLVLGEQKMNPPKDATIAHSPTAKLMIPVGRIISR